MKKKLIYLLGIFLLLSLAGSAVVRLAGTGHEEKEDLLIVTSFYPIYLLTANLTKGAEGVTVKNLTENINGCIHDYQLTTEDMRLLTEADIFIQNGGGMESFMAQAASGLPDLFTVTASDGITLLEGEGHEHAGEEQRTGEELENGQEEGHSHSEEGNSHVWTDPERYLLQIINVEEALCAADPAREALYRSNAISYRAQVEEVSRALKALRAEAEHVPVILFHDAFVYLAESAGMEIVHTVDLDADTAVSAGELAEMIEEAERFGVSIIFTEAGIPNPAADRLALETGAVVYGLDPLVSGSPSGGLSGYIDGMKADIEIIEGAVNSAGR